MSFYTEAFRGVPAGQRIAVNVGTPCALENPLFQASMVFWNYGERHVRVTRIGDKLDSFVVPPYSSLDFSFTLDSLDLEFEIDYDSPDLGTGSGEFIVGWVL